MRTFLAWLQYPSHSSAALWLFSSAVKHGTCLQLVGLIGLFGIAGKNRLVLVTQTRLLMAKGKSFETAVREASIGRVREIGRASCRERV